MAANCVQDLEAAVKAVKDEYGNDPKWSGVIEAADKAVSEAQSVESHSEQSPGQKAASEVHDQVKSPSTPKIESPAEEKKEDPSVEKAESSSEEDAEHPKDMKAASKIALLMLRKK